MLACCCKCCKKTERLEEYSERLEEYEKQIENHLSQERLKKETELLKKTLLEKEKKAEHNTKMIKHKEQEDKKFKRQIEETTDISYNDIKININDETCSCLPKINAQCGFDPED